MLMPGTRRSISAAVLTFWLSGVLLSITVTIIGTSKLRRGLPVAFTVIVSSVAGFLLAEAGAEEEVVLVFCAKVTVGRVQAMARLNAEKRSRVEMVKGIGQLSVCLNISIVMSSYLDHSQRDG